MNEILNLSDNAKATLKKARETYGNKNQIMVCMEELNELACVLAKYPRYDDENKAAEELHHKVLDEVADVLIILDHVTNIFEFAPQEIANRINSKIERVERWLEHSESMQETIDDREVSEICFPSVEKILEDTQVHPCKTCVRRKLVDYNYSNYCCLCLEAQNYKGIAPFYVKDNKML